MASTAYTLTKVGETEVQGTEKVLRWDLYVTNYNATEDVDLTPAELGMNRIISIDVAQQEHGDQLTVWDGDQASPTLTMYEVSTGAELATDQDGGVVRLVVRGK